MMTILFWLSLQLNNDFVRYVWSSARTIISFELVWFAYIWKKVMIFLTVCYIRPDFEDLKSQLVGLGANYVVTEEELKSSEMKKTMKVSSVFSAWLFFPRQPKLAQLGTLYLQDKLKLFPLFIALIDQPSLTS